MDRSKPQVAKLQENFINVLVGSLCNAYTAAGLIPGILIEESETADESSGTDAETSDMTKIDSDDNLVPKLGNGTRKKAKIFYSELTSNFKSNYEMWCEVVRQEKLAESSNKE
jgi:hypothetical protein